MDWESAGIRHIEILDDGCEEKYKRAALLESGILHQCKGIKVARDYPGVVKAENVTCVSTGTHNVKGNPKCMHTIHTWYLNPQRRTDQAQLLIVANLRPKI